MGWAKYAEDNREINTERMNMSDSCRDYTSYSSRTLERTGTQFAYSGNSKSGNNKEYGKRVAYSYARGARW